MSKFKHTNRLKKLKVAFLNVVEWKWLSLWIRAWSEWRRHYMQLSKGILSTQLHDTMLNANI